MIAITGASGKLGRLVITELLKTVSPSEIIALVRNPAKATMLSELGIQVRTADYSQPTSLDAAFQGIDKLLLISSSEIGQRVNQHRNVIDAAKRAGINLLAYTSILHADISPLALAAEHKETESLLKASGVPYVLLRNGWYTENYLASIPTALQHGVLMGCAGEGQIASAAQADYAAAAAVVLTLPNQSGKTYELAGDEVYTLSELAVEISHQSGKPVVYQNLSQTDFKSILLEAGLPEPVADLLAESDTGASLGGLFDDGHQLSKLIGRPTISLAVQVKAAIQQS